LVRASDNAIEIIKYTSRSGNTISGITRAQEGTTGLAMVAGDAFEIRVTEEALEGFLQLSEDLSDLNSAATARTNLGISGANTPFTPAGTIVATDVQAAIEELDSEVWTELALKQTLDAQLTAIAGLTPSGNQVIYWTGVSSAAMTGLTPYARTLLDDADAATARATLGLTAGDAGDIWVEKAGDTMTGDLLMSGADVDIDTGGLTVGGTSRSIVIGGAAAITAKLAVHSEGATDLAGVFFERHSDVVGFGSHLLMSRTRGTEDAEAVVQSGDSLGRTVYLGYDGTDFEQAAEIRVEVDGAPGDGDMPGRILFLVSPDGSATPAEAVRISNDKTMLMSGTLDMDIQTLDLTAGDIDFASVVGVDDCLDEDNMASNSATAIATQQSIKAYADTKASVGFAIAMILALGG
jgi:hypothetical protein